MKKWIVFLSTICVSILYTFILQVKHLNQLINGYISLNDMYPYIAKTYIPQIIEITISLLLLIAVFGFSIVFLVTLVMRKIAPLSISKNLAAWKEHINEKKAIHKQRKLEKAQAKVKQLQNELKKDDD